MPLTCIDAAQGPFHGLPSCSRTPLRTLLFRPLWHESGTNVCPHSAVGQWSTLMRGKSVLSQSAADFACQDRLRAEHVVDQCTRVVASVAAQVASRRSASCVGEPGSAV